MARTTKTAAQKKHKAQRVHQKRRRRLKQASDDRILRIIDEIIGWEREFSGTITTPSTISAESKVLVYYADGSLKMDFWGLNDVLGAGIAWQEDSFEEPEEGEIVENWRTATLPLGINTGIAVDTELFAVAAALGVVAALGVAAERVEQGEDVKLIRVYTDCMGVLEPIANGSITVLGPTQLLGKQP